MTRIATGSPLKVTVLRGGEVLELSTIVRRCVMVEVHPNPAQALSDGAQSLHFEEFETMMNELTTISRALKNEDVAKEKLAV